MLVQRIAAKPLASDGGLLVTPATFLGLVPVLLGLFAAQPAGVQSVTRLVMQDEVILRVPVQPRPQVPRFKWVERKGPRCIPAAAIRRALLSGSEQVDFILSNRVRVRAELEEDCPALDFYGGFYLRMEDELLCADRDAVHSRMGGSCQIEKFKRLVPQLKD